MRMPMGTRQAPVPPTPDCAVTGALYRKVAFVHINKVRAQLPSCHQPRLRPLS